MVVERGLVSYAWLSTKIRCPLRGHDLFYWIRLRGNGENGDVRTLIPICTGMARTGCSCRNKVCHPPSRVGIQGEIVAVERVVAGTYGVERP